VKAVENLTDTTIDDVNYKSSVSHSLTKYLTEVNGQSQVGGRSTHFIDNKFQSHHEDPYSQQQFANSRNLPRRNQPRNSFPSEQIPQPLQQPIHHIYNSHHQQNMYERFGPGTAQSFDLNLSFSGVSTESTSYHSETNQQKSFDRNPMSHEGFSSKTNLSAGHYHPINNNSPPGQHSSVTYTLPISLPLHLVSLPATNPQMMHSSNTMVPQSNSMVPTNVISNISNSSGHHIIVDSSPVSAYVTTAPQPPGYFIPANGSPQVIYSTMPQPGPPASPGQIWISPTGSDCRSLSQDDIGKYIVNSILSPTTYYQQSPVASSPLIYPCGPVFPQVMMNGDGTTTNSGLNNNVAMSFGRDIMMMRSQASNAGKNLRKSTDFIRRKLSTSIENIPQSVPVLNISDQKDESSAVDLNNPISSPESPNSVKRNSFPSDPLHKIDNAPQDHRDLATDIHN
jgi:hypothetical protein